MVEKLVKLQIVHRAKTFNNNIFIDFVISIKLLRRQDFVVEKFQSVLFQPVYSGLCLRQNNIPKFLLRQK